MSKRPTKTLIRQSIKDSRNIITKFEDVDATGEPYVTDAVAFLTQAEVMLKKQLDSMVDTEPKPTTEEKK